MSIRKRSINIIVFLMLYAVTGYAVTVQIGFGTLLNQALPVEPLAGYSYSQSVYLLSEIGSPGVITHIGWQYRVTGSIFLNFTNQYSIYMGVSPRTGYVDAIDWLPADSLTLVFEGNLQTEWFSTPLPGNGWVTVPLNSAYNYSGNGNLVIAVDENLQGGSSTGDDFYCHNSANGQSLEYHSMTINPDPLSPPAANTGNPLSVRPNLRLEIQPVIYAPYNPFPAHQAIDVNLSPTLSWQSSADNWDVYLAVIGLPLQLIAGNLTQPEYTIVNPLNLYTTYQWQVIGHAGADVYPGEVWQFQTVGETISPPQNLSAVCIEQAVHLSWSPPQTGNPIAYRIYRNDTVLDEIPELEFTDTQVAVNQTYWYYIRAVNYLNQLSAPSNQVFVTIPGESIYLMQGFESAPDFSHAVPNWTVVDGDNAFTWGLNYSSFPTEGSPFAWIVFNPSQCTPPVTDVVPASGSKMLVSFDALIPPSNDWLISPPLQTGSGFVLNFKARSWTADYGLERLRVLVSTSDSLISSFSPLSAEPWLSVPAAWTEYSYDLSPWQGQRIFLAWQAVSWDALALCLDEIVISHTIGNQDDNEVLSADFLVYPNPVRDWFCISNPQKKEIVVNMYNAKGQKVLSERCNTDFVYDKHRDKPISKGVYLLRIKSGDKVQIKKIVVIH